MIIARADQKVEYINILGIDLFDESGARIQNGMTPSISPAVYANDPIHWGAQYLTDGIHMQYDANGYRLAHSTADANAYQQIDLGKDTVISKIVVYNRPDNADRINGCDLMVKNDAGVTVMKLAFTGSANVYSYTRNCTIGSSERASTFMCGGIETA